MDESRDEYRTLFGRRLFAIRESKNMTRLELSRHLGIYQSQIAGYERGTLPSAYVAIRLADRLGVSVLELLGVQECHLKGGWIASAVIGMDDDAPVGTKPGIRDEDLKRLAAAAEDVPDAPGDGETSS